MPAFPSAHFSTSFRRVIIPPYQGKKLIILVKLTPVIEPIWGIDPVRKHWHTAQVLWRSMSFLVLSVGHRAPAQGTSPACSPRQSLQNSATSPCLAAQGSEQPKAQPYTMPGLPKCPLIWFFMLQPAWRPVHSMHRSSEEVFESFYSPCGQRAQSAIQPRT